MADQPQFYQKVVALSDQSHKDWRIKAETNYQFANETNAVLLTSIEFSLACREYPIVFISQGNEIRPVAVLGLQVKQNMYVKLDGSWDASYIPAYVRRYRFILAGEDNKAEQFAVCIDETYSGFNRESGELLFTKNGKQSAYLDRVIDFLRDFQAQAARTEVFCKHLKGLKILEPMQANVVSPKAGKVSLAGFHAVSKEKLKALKPVQLSAIVKNDDLELIYAHLMSLSNFGNITRRLNEAA